MTVFIVGLAIVVIGGFLGWWLFIESEGVYLGRRVVIWLYDIYAERYDNIKQFNPYHEHYFLAQPIMAQISPQEDPFVLDVAAGSGRLAVALWQHARFRGRVVSLDLSYRMLKQAHLKLLAEHFRDGVDLVYHNADELPFLDASFDVVTCLEALEFMPNKTKVLSEMARVLRPGGTLFISQRINTRWMPGKLWSDDYLIYLLDKLGFNFIEIEPWQYDYKKVWAQKTGQSIPIGPNMIQNCLSCPHQRQMIDRCPDCHKVWRQDDNGIYCFLNASNTI